MKVIRSLGLVVAGAVAVAAPVGKTFQNIFNSVEYVRTHDGDTVIVNIPLLPKVFGHNLPIRIAHIDAPELISDSPCEKREALTAALEVENLLSDAKHVDLINPKRDKYFRLVADIVIDNKILLSKHLLDKKLAYPYEGETKQVIDWCNYATKKTLGPISR